MGKHPGGRPRKEIDQKSFENLCELQCTKEEICGFFDVTDKTLDSWCARTYNASFSEVFKAKRGKGRIALRRWQMQAAQKGNTSMLIFLGKNYLAQTDAMRVEANVADGKLADLIEGLKEPYDDIHEEATGTDAVVADKPAEAP